MRNERCSGPIGPLWWIGVLVLAVSWANVARAEPTLYGVNATNCGCFFSIDLASGEFAHIGPVGPQGSLPSSMAVGVDETIYVVDNNGPGYLLTIDIETGLGTPVGSGLGVCHGLAIAPVPVPGPSGMLPAGTLFAYQQTASAHRLIIIDKETGSITLVAPVTRGYYGLEFRADGVLFGAGYVPGSVWQLTTLHTGTGAETLIGNLGVGDGVGALVFKPSGELLISTLGPVIWEVDQITAELSNPVILNFDELCCEGPPQGLGFATAPPIAVDHVSWGQIKGSYR